jgi:hypothetical protein
MRQSITLKMVIGVPNIPSCTTAYSITAYSITAYSITSSL